MSRLTYNLQDNAASTTIVGTNDATNKALSGSTTAALHQTTGLLAALAGCLRFPASGAVTFNPGFTATGACSIAFWAKGSSGSSEFQILDNAGDAVVRLNGSGSGGIYIADTDGAATSFTTTGGFDFSQTHFYCITLADLAGGTAKLYVDGALVDTKTSPDASGEITFTRVGQLLATLTADLCGLNFYDSEINAAAVAALYAEGVASVPTISVNPTYTGFQYPGYTFTGGNGTWNNTPTSYAYKWQRANDGSGAGAADISGATSSTYVVQSADQGKWVREGVLASNASGPAAAYAYSAWVQVLTITARPTATTKRPIFTDVSGYAGDTTLNEVTSDNSDAAVPDPVTWNTSTAAAGTFSPVSVYGQSNTKVRSNSPCGVALSNLFVLMGHLPVAVGDAIGFLKADNTAVNRTIARRWNIGGTNLWVGELNSALSGITPFPLLTNPSAISGRSLIAIEADRHLSIHTAGVIQSAYVNFTSGADGLESGDSNKPMLVVIDGTIVNLGPILQATYCENASTYIDEICAILATQSEAPTLVTVGGGEGGFSGGLSGALLGCLDGGFA